MNRAAVPEFAIVVCLVGGGRRVEVTGELDLLGAATLRTTLDLAAQDGGPIELDLSRVTFFGAAAVTALLMGRDAAGDRLVLLAVSAPVRRVLDLVDLAEEFDVVPADGRGKPRSALLDPRGR